MALSAKNARALIDGSFAPPPIPAPPNVVAPPPPAPSPPPAPAPAPQPAPAPAPIPQPSVSAPLVDGLFQAPPKPAPAPVAPLPPPLVPAPAPPAPPAAVVPAPSPAVAPQLPARAATIAQPMIDDGTGALLKPPPAAAAPPAPAPVVPTPLPPPPLPLPPPPAPVAPARAAAIAQPTIDEGIKPPPAAAAPPKPPVPPAAPATPPSAPAPPLSPASIAAILGPNFDPAAATTGMFSGLNNVPAVNPPAAPPSAPTPPAADAGTSGAPGTPGAPGSSSSGATSPAKAGPTLDDILALINANPALSQVQLANEKAGKTAASAETAAIKNLLLGYGSQGLSRQILTQLAASDPRLAAAIGDIEAFVGAKDAKGNPLISDNPDSSTSILAQLARGYRAKGREQDENFNDQRLYYSGARARAVNDLSYQQQVDRATQEQGLEDKLSAAALGLTNADSSAEQAYLDAYQNAYNAALQEALQFGGASAGGGDTTPTIAAAAPADPAAATAGMFSGLNNLTPADWAKIAALPINAKKKTKPAPLTFSGGGGGHFSMV